MNELVSFQSAQKSLLGGKMLDCWKGGMWEAASVGAALSYLEKFSKQNCFLRRIVTRVSQN